MCAVCSVQLSVQCAAWSVKGQCTCSLFLSRRDPQEEGDQKLSQEDFMALVRQLLDKFNNLRWTWLKEEG